MGFVARMSQIAFFTRDGDMRDRRSRISRPERGALIRATFPTLAPMGAAAVTVPGDRGADFVEMLLIDGTSSTIASPVASSMQLHLRAGATGTRGVPVSRR